MAINVTHQCPDQPASGICIEQRLGGPGRVSPHSCFDVQLVIAADASGGAIAASIHTDPRYSSLFSFVGIAIAGAAAGIPYHMDLFGSESGTYGPSAEGTTAFHALWSPRATWCPPPFLCTSNEETTDTLVPSRLVVIIPNTNGETLYLNTRVYNFLKDVASRTAVTQLYQCLPRGSSIT